MSSWPWPEVIFFKFTFLGQVIHALLRLYDTNIMVKHLSNSVAKEERFAKRVSSKWHFELWWPIESKLLISQSWHEIDMSILIVFLTPLDFFIYHCSRCNGRVSKLFSPFTIKLKLAFLIPCGNNFVLSKSGRINFYEHFLGVDCYVFRLFSPLS